MSLRKAASTIVFVCLLVGLVPELLFAQSAQKLGTRDGSQPAQDADRDGAKHPQDFEKAEKGDFQKLRDKWFYGQRAYPHKHTPSGVRLQALKQLNQKLAAEKRARALGRRYGKTPQSEPAWTAIGPQPVDGFGLVNSGRVTAVAVDPANNQVVYAGAADGGIWKTTNGGSTWTALTDQQASLATGSIAIDPENHLTIYVGTGEENQAVDNYYGAGILKSTDGGNTWTNIPGPFAGGSGGGARIGGMAVSPTNSNVVLAAIGCCAPNTWGVYRSGDGGNTWTNVLNYNGNQAFNVVFAPNGTTAYASVDYDGVWISTNGGQTWAAQNGTGGNVLPTGGNAERVALAMDPNTSTTLYAGISDNSTGGMLGLWKTTDGGNNWIQLTNTPNLCGGQCWYDFVIAVAPGNSNAVFGGGSGWGNQLYQSLDGGNTWVETGPAQNSTIHPDLHALTFSADGSILYIGVDGGMYSTTEISTTLNNVTSLNAGSGPGTGLGTLQFYAGPAIHPTNVNDGFGGTQDNGSMQYSGSLTWNFGGACGDGARNLIDPANPNNVYESCVQLSIWKSTDGGSADSFNQSQNGINPNGTDSVPWVAPFTMDLSNTQNLYFGTNYVYQTTNGASSWAAISPDFTNGTGNLSAIAVSPVNSNIVYAGANGSSGPLVYMTTNALSGASWTNVTGSIFPNRTVTVISMDPVSASTGYAGFSGFTGYGDSAGHIFMTTNNGVSWTDVSGDLPNTPVNDIFVDPDMGNTVFVATDVGVFYTTNLGISWGSLVESLPQAAVTGLAYQHANRVLWAGTHGRSMWSTTLTGLLPVPGITSILPNNAVVGSGTFTLTVNGDGFNASSVVEWNGTVLATTFVSASQLTAQVPASDLATAAYIPVTVANPGATVSNAVTFTVANPTPGIGSLVPSNATAGGPSFTLTVNGSNFVNGSQVLWNGSGLTTTFVSSGKVTATVPASDIVVAGTAQVSVSNPAPGGGTSATLPFTITNLAPSLTSITPSSKVAGSASFKLTVKGTGFVSGAEVQFNGANLATKFVKSAELTATVTAADVATAGTFPVTATNPGSGASNALTFAVDNPKPKLTSISPSSATHGGPGFTLTVNGTGFLPTTVVNWNGSPRATTYVSATKLTAQITAQDIANKGKAKVTATNPTPGGGTSNSETFTIE